MKKRLYLIGGTMGAGKTTVCQCLKSKLDRCVFLDGDWCWDMRPFQVTEETKAMALGNICYLLNSFLRCSAFDHVIFCWMMHQQPIIDAILSRLWLENCDVMPISLLCDENALRKRLEKDVESGLRTADVIDRSLARLPLYQRLNTIKLNVSALTAEKAAEKILALSDEELI